MPITILPNAGFIDTKDFDHTEIFVLMQFDPGLEYCQNIADHSSSHAGSGTAMLTNGVPTIHGDQRPSPRPYPRWFRKLCPTFVLTNPLQCSNRRTIFIHLECGLEALHMNVFHIQTWESICLYFFKFIINARPDCDHRPIQYLSVFIKLSVYH